MIRSISLNDFVGEEHTLTREEQILVEKHNSKKREIEKRLQEFKKEKTERELFTELCFCLLTPQSKARTCDKAIKKLIEKNLLFSGTSDKIELWLVGVRFSSVKAKRIVKVQTLNGKLKEKLKGDSKEVRKWFIENVNGFGYKESGHFLRNVGLGENLAILDRHILKNLIKYECIKETPRSLTPKKYIEIEDKMKQFSKRVKIPLSHLDLLFWSEETGEIFK